MIKFLCVFVLFFSSFCFAASPLTINTINIGGKFIPLTGSAGAVVDLATGIGRATPWIAGITTAYQVYKLADDLALFSVRPSGVATAEYSGGASSPPSSMAATSPNWLYDVNGSGPKYTDKQATANLLCQTLGASTGRPFFSSWNGGFAPTGTQGVACRNADGTSVSGYAWSVNGYNTNGSTLACSTGYTLSGSVCNLTDVAHAMYPSDGKYTYVVDSASGVLVADTRDPDFALGTTFRSDVSPSSITVNSSNNGLPVQEIVTPSTTGLTVTTKTQELVNGETRTYQQSVTYNNAGAVTSYTANTYQGPLSAPGATALITSGSGTGQSITFPSDYARQGESQAAADSINSTLSSKLDTLHHDLTDTAAPPNDPSSRTDTEISDQFFKNTFDDLKGWSLPAHISQCPVGSFNWNGQTFALNTHCQLVQDHWSTLQAAMMVVWTIAALFIVLKA